ncbi:MAG TPA: hypothetical protein VEV19_15150 [Ktedonobacteraceae bacterium]|nr:hypothetical protein [Ktedonobacteraceae bacterium]
MQGHLRHESLSVEIATACADCGQPLHITLDSELRWSIQEQDATPYVFMPDIDWNHFTEPTIIDAY